MLSCTDAEFSSIYPANPPVDIKMNSLNNGDYLLLFRSENTSNARFGGFYIYIAAEKEDVIEETEVSYILGIAEEGDSSTVYNTGIDSQIAVLFSDTAAEEVTFNNNTYAITATRSKSELISGYWLTLRTYLYNSTTEEVIEDELSSPGNPVEIDAP